MRIALVQINLTVGDLSGNRDKIIRNIKKVRKFSPDIVVFPELAVCGYPPEDLLLKPHFINDNLKVLRQIVKQTAGLTVIAGFADRKEGHIYNAAALMHNGKIAGVYRKMYLPNYGVFDEKRYFASGSKDFCFVRSNITFGVNICEDIWRRTDLGCAGYIPQVIINISASPYYIGKGRIREKLLSRRAKENGVVVCYNNLVGGQDELVFDGGSLIFDWRGKKIGFAKRFEEDILIKDIIQGSGFRGQGAGFGVRGSGLADDVIMLPAIKKCTLKTKLPRRQAVAQKKGEDAVYAALVLGLRDYVRKNGFSKIVMGISGGIDSALVAAIAIEALGRENVIGVSMPSVYTSKKSYLCISQLVKNLQVKFFTIPIDYIFEKYRLALESVFRGGGKNSAEENLQARIRGNILMALSNKFGWLVLTTGNKSEVSVGYCTLYGDMAGGFALIKDIPKGLVYKLACLINRKNGRKLIPAEIIKRAPSAELAYNQKDQDILPEYDVLDSILEKYIEKENSLDDILKAGLEKKAVREVIALVDKNEYKRRQAPPGIKITPKAFGRDRRFPITNQYREW